MVAEYQIGCEASQEQRGVCNRDPLAVVCNQSPWPCCDDGGGGHHEEGGRSPRGEWGGHSRASEALV